jgi:alkaline phosphatase D
MLVEVSRTPSFRRSALIEGPVLTPETDLTGKVRLRGLRPGRRVFYRVQLEDLDNAFVTSVPLQGSLRTAPRRRGEDVSFVWGADIAGQGYGINPEFGGYRIFRAMEALGRTSSSAAATRCTRTGPWRRPSRFPTAACGAT